MNVFLLLSLWMIGTTLVCITAATACVLTGYLSWTHKRWVLVIPALLLAFLSGASAVANPVVNVLLFARETEEASMRLFGEMREMDPAECDVETFQGRFGQPEDVLKQDGREYWLYNPNPWWTLTWTKVGVSVEEGTVTGVYLDD